jgi:hypothetical protein
MDVRRIELAQLLDELILPELEPIAGDRLVELQSA